MKALFSAILLIAISFCAFPAKSENNFSGPLLGHLWIMSPATSWQYQDLGALNLKELDLYSWSGWSSKYETWKVWTSGGQKYLFRINGLYIDAVIPLPSNL